MAGPFGSPFGSSFKAPFSSPFGSSASNPDDVFRKQMETMAATLAKGGVKLEPIDQRTWLEKFFNVLNRPLGATTSLISGFVKPGSDPGQGARQALDVLTGKKTYGAKELLDDTLGKSDSFGRKAAAFALGIPLDPLTWIPISKIAKPLLGASAKGARAAGLGNQVDELGNIASSVKKFFGYDDFARFGPKAEKVAERIVDGKKVKVVIQPAQADMRETARQLTQLVGSNTARRGFEIDKYMEQVKDLFGTLKMTPDESTQFLRAIEPSMDATIKLKAGEKLAPNVQKAVDAFKGVMKEFGDEKAKLGLIEDVTADFKKVGVPKRIGGETSEGYIKHVINPDFLRKYPSLSDVPEELQAAAKPFYEIGSKKVYSRKMPGSILDANRVSVAETGMKMFEENPIKILQKEIEDMAQIKAQRDIVDAIKGLKDASGKPIIQEFDDQGLAALSRKMNVAKDATGKQLITKLRPGTEMETFLKELLTQLNPENPAAFTENIVKNIPSSMATLTNPLFKKAGKVTAANADVAAIINKLSEEIPGEAANPLIRSLDKITSMWKKLAVTNPKFHINNWFGANTNNLIDDTAGTIKHAPMVSEIIKGGSKKTYTFKNGFSGTADEIMEMFKKSGEISGFTKAEAFPKNPVDAISRASGAIGGKIEEQARLTAYLNAMDRGLSPSEALQRVFQIHGNYAPEAMSKFEKDVIKRIIPFYTWAKTSVPYQAQSLVNKTGVYSNLAHAQSMVASDEDRKGLPDWLRSRVLLSTSQNKDGSHTARQLPMSVPDLEMFNDPTKVLLSKLNPLLKIPIELGQNRGSFFGETLFDPNKFNAEGKRVPMSEQTWDYISKQIPLFTAYKQGKKYAEEELASTGLDKNAVNFILAAIAGQIDPTGPKSFDPARERYAQDSAQSELMRNIISNLRRNGIIPPAK